MRVAIAGDPAADIAIRLSHDEWHISGRLSRDGRGWRLEYSGPRGRGDVALSVPVAAEWPTALRRAIAECLERLP